MSSNVLTELGLRHPGGRSGAGSEVGPGTHLAGAHRPVIDRALTLIGEALSADNDSPDAARLVAEIQGHRRALAEAEDPSSLGTLSETCFQAYGTELAKVRARQSAKYAEIGSLVSMMREAIAAIASCHNTFSSNLDTSTGKFEAMTHVNALRQLKGQLTTEVAVLDRKSVV